MHQVCAKRSVLFFLDLTFNFEAEFQSVFFWGWPASIIEGTVNLGVLERNVSGWYRGGHTRRLQLKWQDVIGTMTEVVAALLVSRLQSHLHTLLSVSTAWNMSDLD